MAHKRSIRRSGVRGVPAALRRDKKELYSIETLKGLQVSVADLTAREKPKGSELASKSLYSAFAAVAVFSICPIAASRCNASRYCESVSVIRRKCSRTAAFIPKLPSPSRLSGSLLLFISACFFARSIRDFPCRIPAEFGRFKCPARASIRALAAMVF